jgi:protein-tyrosine-phosphatase
MTMSGGQPQGVVVVVCRGNSCRSPMGAGLIRRALDAFDLQALEVNSRGLEVEAGEKPSWETRRTAFEGGVDLSNHRATQLTPGDVESALIVITMSGAQRTDVLQLVPEATSRVLPLREVASRCTGAHSSEFRDSAEIADPMGQAVAAYRALALELHELAQAFARGLALGWSVPTHST